MNETALKYGAAPFASVNLVPKEIAERKKMRAVRMVAIVALLATVALVVLGYLSALGMKAVAQRDLNDAAKQQYSAIETRDKNVPVYLSYVQREQQELALSQAGWAEIEYSNLTSAVANTANSKDANFDSLSFVGPSALGVPGPSGDLLFGNGVGLVTFEAYAKSPTAASDLIARIEAVPGVGAVRANSEAYGGVLEETYWKVSGSAVITTNALTNRFLADNELTGIDVLSLVIIPDAPSGDEDATPPSQEPTPSAEPTTEGEG